jgi:hypothetical protein
MPAAGESISPVFSFVAAMFYQGLMASQPESLCFTDEPPIAVDVARGVTRLFCRQDLFAICEMPLPNGRRADLMAIDAKGGLTIVEIKVARADLVGDCKWTDYLEYCDRFFWAVPPHLAHILEEERYQPGDAGLIVADRYDAAIVREATHRPLAPARRKAGLLRFARRAARRLAVQIDPSLGEAN